jgi:hypothetical protein
VTNLVLLHKENKVINQREVTAVICRHDDFPDDEVYCSATVVKLVKPGNKEDYFINVVAPLPENTTINQGTEEVGTEERPTEISTSGILLEDDIHRIIQEGFTVDDDNSPVEDNIPANNDVRVEWNAWGFLGIDLRHEYSQKFNHHPPFSRVKFHEEFNLFWQFFLRRFVENAILPQTNKHLTKELKNGEFT